ncbi:YceI family protein [Rhodocytophaga aerolata]|uniref:YceI family protein n=1 Tax=Rhodocytophaga aerolata TaxID=455078 RepID=A0ABT8R751_9BACT|nr:YceI family protein [Rhodocytophaga aerolata]MDO1447933.1 YceI family protein [Rhodocytophaga aerolata]
MNPIHFAMSCLLLFIPQGILPAHLLPYNAPVEQSYRVILSDESKLSIVGRTNISQFTCKYTQTIEPDVLDVYVRQEKDGLVFSNAFILLQTMYFKAGPSQMNQDLQTFLKVKEYPTATIRLLKLRLTKAQLADSQLQKAMSEMEITLAGVTKTYEIPVSISRNGEERLLSGGLELNICDFNLEPPVVMMGMIRVKEAVKVNFMLRACIEKNIIN